MFAINSRWSIPDDELAWQFVRSSGPGGQNVNKVASKAVLHWDLGNNQTVPDEVKARLAKLHGRRLSKEGYLVLSSQRFRDQEKNKQDCLDKLREMLLEASVVPKVRRPTKPSKGSRERRLQDKKRRGAAKATRRAVGSEEN